MATDVANDKQQWLEDVRRLLDEIQSWCEAERWLVHRQAKKIRERKFGEYEVDALTVKGPQGHLCVDPVARFVMGAKGRVDLYAWPSLHRFMLVREDGAWIIRTDSGVKWPTTWGRDTFLNLANELIQAT